MLGIYVIGIAAECFQFKLLIRLTIAGILAHIRAVTVIAHHIQTLAAVLKLDSVNIGFSSHWREGHFLIGAIMAVPLEYIGSILLAPCGYVHAFISVDVLQGCLELTAGNSTSRCLHLQCHSL